MKLTLLLLSTMMVLVACSDDDNSSSTPNTVLEAGIFNTPDGAGSPGPATAGNSYSFNFSASPGQRLTFVTMYVTTNDLVFAPRESGVDLYPSGTALSGDITDQIILVDAGTEINQPIGSGSDQANMQSGPNTGADDTDDRVRIYDGGDEASTASTISVTVSNDGSGNFTVTIDNLPGSTTPIAPGVFAVFTGQNPIFNLGTPDEGNGLEALAEDGNATDLGAHLQSLIN